MMNVAEARGEAINTPASVTDIDPLAGALELLCRLNNRDMPRQMLVAGLPLADGRLTLDLVPRAARRAGIETRVLTSTLPNVASELLPAILVLVDGKALVLKEIAGDNYICLAPELPEKPISYAREALEARYSGRVVYATERELVDARADDVVAARNKHWFWSRVIEFRARFSEVGVASLVANTLAIVTALFAMQVYDRVIPAFAYSTLWALAIGVLVAIFFEKMLRGIRARIMDRTGRKIDLQISAVVFEQAMNIRCAARPRSAGSFVNQVREVEAVREFFTSSTIGAISDLPFVFLFLFVIWLIGGPLVFILLVTIPLIILGGLIAQFPLRALSARFRKQGAIRNGLLVEAISNPETIKAYQGESMFQKQWEEHTTALAENSMKQRELGMDLTQFTTALQQISYVAVVVAGVYLVEAGTISVGAIIGCSILTSRTMAPLVQLAQIFARWQQMSTALNGLDKIMALPVDRPASVQFVNRPALQGSYEASEVSFSYNKDEPVALKADSLSLTPGDSVALLGNNGAGKSTLLKLLAGLYAPTSGNLLLDGTDIAQIDPVDLRRQIGYLPQAVTLFYGTLRSNLLFGLGPVDDAELLNALEFAGASDLVRRHPKGLDRQISEGGRDLSGGQCQSVGLARLWLRNPSIVLMDEPTAAMDQTTEAAVIENLRSWLPGRTCVIATHRHPILKLAEKAVVMRNGRVVAFDACDVVLARYGGGPTNTQSGRGAVI